MAAPAGRSLISRDAVIRGASGGYVETVSVGAFVAGSLAAAQTISPIAGVTVAGREIAPGEAMGVTLISPGDTLSGGTSRGSPPQLTHAAPIKAMTAV
jgi:hypothetical protein